ncbi:glycoside hydrolase family 26 protein [Catellatospora tritici]|uniref:glycoside hydrolase family 26 protein n=1 Tax=Catellatospora tritici TaxID=2851566 RepID=UPI001C2DBF5B|nr:beta-mannanase [Catellatospora tritici]MBV1853488.1 beta-mannanase [Catellatospora tritici]
MRKVIPAVGLTLALTAGVGACAPKGDNDVPSRTARPRSTANAMPPPSSGPFATTGRGPELPDDGAWFGAYVDAPQRTGDRLDAISAFEQAIGRELTIAHSFHPWREDFPSTYDYELVHRGKLLLLSWAGTDTRSLLTGVYDDEIRRRAEAVLAFRAPILLRYRWEMDRPNLQPVVHSPEDFVAAWKHVRQIFTEVGATNAGWVWCPHADGFVDGRALPYYPGDDQVDWLCADVYPDETMPNFTQMMAPVMDFARQHPRPLIIGEFGVEKEGEGERAGWFDEMRQVLHEQPQIKAVVYFHGRTDKKPFYDTTFEGEPSALEAFRKLADDDYLSSNPFN